MEQWFQVDPPARQGAKLPIRPKGMKISIAVIAEPEALSAFGNARQRMRMCPGWLATRASQARMPG